MPTEKTPSKQNPLVEVITDKDRKPSEQPLVTIRTGQTDEQTIYFRINQPKGRALLIAVHL